MLKNKMQKYLNLVTPGFVNFFSWCKTITRYNQGEPYDCACKTNIIMPVSKVISSVNPGTKPDAREATADARCVCIFNLQVQSEH